MYLILQKKKMNQDINKIYLMQFKWKFDGRKSNSSQKGKKIVSMWVQTSNKT